MATGGLGVIIINDDYCSVRDVACSLLVLESTATFLEDFETATRIL